MDKYIIITGAAGFIGSCLVSKFNSIGITDLILVDDFTKKEKQQNLKGKKYFAHVHRDELIEWLHQNAPEIKFVYHLGARTDTAEFDYSILENLNLNYSKSIWNYCTENKIPLVYASSAATYGNGEFGYTDDHALPEKLNPLNPYGISKNEFDKWVLTQINTPPFWYGLKFFNVYGPNEYHKGRMASVIFHAYHQIGETGKLKLFRSHHEAYKDGEQLRDFIYVKDILDICLFFHHRFPPNGIYNAGTGKARSFLDLGKSVFNALGKPVNIEFIDMPSDIRDKYQYFTQANMHKLTSAGYSGTQFSLEEGVYDYVKNYLEKNRYF